MSGGSEGGRLQMRIDNVHEIHTTRDYDREISKEELTIIRETLLSLGWDAGFTLTCNHKTELVDLTISAYPIKPDPEGVLR
jgi:hypothetical protein